ncbi:MAG TPA: glycosyltransferase [Nevskiaceae bacterium]|nr:glycosyltransferase [Nevskiaceae bacterium]
MARVTILAGRRLEVGLDPSLGVHKFHSHWGSRLGGVPIGVAIGTGLLLDAWLSGIDTSFSVAFIVCMLPAFGIGMAEDLTAKAGVATRLVFTMISSALGWWLLLGKLTRIDVPQVDLLLASVPLAAFVLTLVASAGVAHAVNIVDGYNGLSGFYSVVVFLSLAYVGWQVNDVMIVHVSLLFAAAVLGFLYWNFPYGLIFLGDAGAYVVGFAVGELSILLVSRNPEVSAWCPMLLAVYPVTETLFAIYRKQWLRGISPGLPDGLHFHMLIYKRLMKLRFADNASRQMLMRNSATSPYLWIITLVTAAPAVMLWNHREPLMAACAIFALAYLWLYWRIIRFRTPRFLVLRGNLVRSSLADRRA